MRLSTRLPLLFAFLLGSYAAHAQQPATPTLSDDSVRVMSGLVQTSVRQLRTIYFEPNDAQAVQLIDAAVRDITPINQRLRQYTAGLNREQQQELTRRLRQQPWQIELQTLLRSPQYKGFEARAAKNPDLKAASVRLRSAGLIGSGSTPPAPAATAAAGPAVSAPKPAAANSLVPVKPESAGAVASAPGQHHTVQKGETLYSIARQYKTTPAQLQQWNDKAEPSVKIGEVLVVEATR